MRHYFTLVRTANSPRLLFLGGELVGGETPWWRDDRIPNAEHCVRRFWAKEGCRKWAVFLFNFSSAYHIYISKYLVTSRGNKSGRDHCPSSFRPRLKKRQMHQTDLSGNKIYHIIHNDNTLARVRSLGIKVVTAQVTTSGTRVREQMWPWEPPASQQAHCALWPTCPDGHVSRFTI